MSIKISPHSTTKNNPFKGMGVTVSKQSLIEISPTSVYVMVPTDRLLGLADLYGEEWEPTKYTSKEILVEKLNQLLLDMCEGYLQTGEY